MSWFKKIASVLDFLQTPTKSCPHKTQLNEYYEFMVLLTVVISVLLLRSFILWFLKTDEILEAFRTLKSQKHYHTRFSPRDSSTNSVGRGWKRSPYWFRGGTTTQG